MSAVTFPKTLSGQNAVSAKPAKGFFARLLDAVVAARTAQAEREIARYLRGREQF